MVKFGVSNLKFVIDTSAAHFGMLITLIGAISGLTLSAYKFVIAGQLESSVVFVGEPFYLLQKVLAAIYL